MFGYHRNDETAVRGRQSQARRRVGLLAGLILVLSLLLAACSPTPAPVAAPVVEPTTAPTTEPAAEPTPAPTAVAPTTAPTTEPTAEPTTEPAADPTPAPTAVPTMAPTAEPTAAASAARPTPLPSDEGEVEMEDFKFNPPVLVVRAGATVKFANKDDVQHTATSDTGVWDSGSLTKGQEFFFTFSEPGEYPYYCIPHGSPGGNGMAATIIVVP